MTYARRFFYDALVFDPTGLRRHRLPVHMGDLDPVGTLEKAGFDAGVLAAIRAGNAKRFLGLM